MDMEKLTDSGLIDRLEADGCALRAVGDRLRCVVPGGGALEEDVRREISRRKEGLLELLRGRRIGLSHEQERLWFIDKYSGPRQSAYHMPAAFRIRGKLDRDALSRSLSGLVARHEILRTVFKSEHGQPFQEIEPPSVVRIREEAVNVDGLERALADEATRPFDLAKGPLTRIKLFRLG
ncbi:MAG: condensation domain-containing protein, partial [Candidatus Geothermincolia bacterium]